MNFICVIGRVEKPPELRFTQDGETQAYFTMTQLESYKNRNGNKIERTETFNVMAYDSLADECLATLVPGMSCTIQGALVKGEGHRVFIEAHKIEPIGSKRAG